MAECDLAEPPRCPVPLTPSLGQQQEPLAAANTTNTLPVAAVRKYPIYDIVAPPESPSPSPPPGQQVQQGAGIEGAPPLPSSFSAPPTLDTTTLQVPKVGPLSLFYPVRYPSLSHLFSIKTMHSHMSSFLF